MTRREQELVDQHRQWREQIDATPETPWYVETSEPDTVEERRARIKERRAARMSAPLPSRRPTIRPLTRTEEIHLSPP